MATLNFVRWDVFPENPQPSSLYLVKAAQAGFLDVYQTGDEPGEGGTLEVRRIFGVQDVDAAVAAALATANIPAERVVGELSNDTTGNAATASALKDAITINGVAVNAGDDVEIPAVDTATPRLAASAVGQTVAPLVGGVIPAQYIANTFDNVETFPTRADFPEVGRTDTIYIDEENNVMWRYRTSPAGYIASPAGGGLSDTALRWETARKITVSGDIGGEVTIDGSEDESLVLTLPVIPGLTAGEFAVVRINTKGQVTQARALTDTDLPAQISASKLTGEASVDTTGNAATATALAQAITLRVQGDANGTVSLQEGGDEAVLNLTVTGGGGGSNPVTTPGRYPVVTINDKGQVVSGDALLTSDLPNAIPLNKLATGTATISISGNAATATTATNATKADEATGVTVMSNW